MSPINRELLEKYMQGLCTPREETAVHRWLDENDIDDYSPGGREGRDGKKLTRNWNRLAVRIKELKIVTPRRRRLPMKIFRVAAAVAGVALTVSAVLYAVHVRSNMSYRTSYGEIKQINLPDGTMVTLNAKSILKVKTNFNTKNRDVYLAGEAYFQVKRHAGLPFIVHTAKLSVTALGTSFDLSAFADDPSIAVSLKEGKVLVKSTLAGRADPTRIVLKPGEEAVYRKNTASLQVRKFDPRSRLAWQAQDIYFENAGIGEVLRKLARFYGVSFDTSRLKPHAWHLSGEYKNQTLKDVMESLSFNYDLGYKIEGREVILFER